MMEGKNIFWLGKKGYLFFFSVVVISFYLACAQQKGDGVVDKPDDVEVFISDSDKKTIENSLRAGIVTARLVSRSESSVKSYRLTNISRNISVNVKPVQIFAPRIDIKQLQNCNCVSDYNCIYAEVEGLGTAEPSFIVYQVFSESGAYKVVAYGTSLDRIYLYQGVCENMPERICADEKTANYNFEQNCEFSQIGFLSENFMCVEDSSSFVNEATFIVDTSSFGGKTAYTIISSEKAKKFECDFGMNQCDIYEPQECNLSLGCGPDLKREYELCNFQKVSSCLSKIECGSKIAELFVPAGDLVTEKSPDYCEKLRRNGEVVNIRKSGENWEYTISTGENLSFMLCGDGSSVDMQRCEINCQEISKSEYNIRNFNDYLTYVRYNAEISENDVQGTFDITYVQATGEVKFNGKVSVKENNFSVEGTVSRNGSVKIKILNGLSAELQIMPGGLISGEFKVGENTFSVSTDEKGNIKVCDMNKNCFTLGR